MSAAPSARRRHVTAVPYPGRGHVNPMMNLCRGLLASSAPGLLISFVVTEEWRGLMSSDPPPPPGVRIATIPNCIPPEAGRALDFPAFLDAVYTKMAAPFEDLLDRMTELPVEAIVADSYVPWAVEVGNRRNIPVYSLFPMSPTFFSTLFHYHRIPPAARDRHVTGEADGPLSEYIPGHNSLRLSDLHIVFTAHRPRARALDAVAMVSRAQCLMFTSFYELEAQIIDSLKEYLPFPIYTVGPSIPHLLLEKPSPIPNGSSGDADYIAWLDSQPKQSVLYVSLGSFLSVSGSQMDEIAMGLGLSGVRFLWVGRGDSSRLQEMVGGMGIVLPWCDQLRVLSHPSVGGFLTHCGLNSTLEAVFCGVPMLTCPIFWDQPPNARLIVDEWRVGLSLRGKAGRDGVVGREEIASVVKRLMDLDGAEGKEMRRRAAELRDSAHRAVAAGGSSSENLESVVRGLMQGSVC